MKKFFTDRSRTETAQRCKRRRWLEYYESGVGVQSRKKNLALAVGGAVHAGLAKLIQCGQEHLSAGLDEAVAWIAFEEAAVVIALEDFNEYALGGLELDATESTAMSQTEAQDKLNAELIQQAKDLGMSPEGLGYNRDATMSQFQGMLYREQAALVEGMVRAYARRRLRPLLEQFEVLEVEREGEWKLSGWIGCDPNSRDDDTERLAWDNDIEARELWFMSRPDALLRERQTNELYILSFKTTGTWGDVRKARSAEVDMQGLSEGVEVEKRLGEWWETVKSCGLLTDRESMPKSMIEYLRSCVNPPRIHAIRYEYLLKGERWEDKELSSRLGMTVRTQRSHLIRQYVATSTPKKGDGGYSVGDVSWSWDYHRVEDDKDSKLAWQNWKSRPVYEDGGSVKEWIDKLDSTEECFSGEDSTMGLEPRFIGYKSAAQSMGVTREHPLDAVFVPPIIVFRQDDQLRDWFEQIEEQEREIAERAEKVNSMEDEGERHSLLNRYFPQSRGSCYYPSECPFAKEVCWGANPETRDRPLTSERFAPRIPNHPQEAEGKEGVENVTAIEPRTSRKSE